MALQSSLQQFQETLARRLSDTSGTRADVRLAFESGAHRYLVHLQDTSEVMPPPGL